MNFSLFTFFCKVIASDLPFGLVKRAAPFCSRLEVLHFHARDGDTADFWGHAARCLKLLQPSALKELTVKGRHGESREASASEASPMFSALAALDVEVGRFSLELLPLGEVTQQVAVFLSGAKLGLSSLTLKQCGLSGPDAAPLEYLCERLGALQFKNLLTLDLSMNALCLEGANLLGEFLHLTPQVQTLQLGGNGLGPAGLASLVPSLAKLPLQSLDLSLNGLGTTGVETLRPANLKLQSLNLRGNWFGSSHSEILVDLLQSMSGTLIKLDISCLGLNGQL